MAYELLVGNGYKHMDAQGKSDYIQHVLYKYADVSSVLTNARHKKPFNILAEPAIQQNIPLYLQPLSFKLKPTFKSKLRSRVVQTCTVKQPFSDYTSLLTVSQSGTVILWDEHSQNKYETFTVGRGATMSAAVNESGSVLACGGLSCFVELYSIGRELNERLYPGRAAAENLPLYEDKSAALPGTGRPSEYRYVLGGHEEAVSGLAFMDENVCLSAGLDGMVYAWDLVKAVNFQETSQIFPITGIASSNTDKNSYVTGARDGSLRLRDLRERELSCEILLNKSPVINVKYMPDGNTLLCAFPHDAHLIDLRTFGIMQTYHCPHGFISTFDTSPSGRVAIFGTESGCSLPVDLVANNWFKSFTSYTDRISAVNIVEDKAYISSWDCSFSSYSLLNQ